LITVGLIVALISHVTDFIYLYVCHSALEGVIVQKQNGAKKPKLV